MLGGCRLLMGMLALSLIPSNPHYFGCWIPDIRFDKANV